MPWKVSMTKSLHYHQKSLPGAGHIVVKLWSSIRLVLVSVDVNSMEIMS
jgi:hypothetical protein